jgi:hypothetical protein
MADSINTADAIIKDGGNPNIVGDPDKWQLLSKYVSTDKSLITSTKAMEIEGVGCVVSEYRKEGIAVSTTSVFVPGVKVVHDPTVVSGGKTGRRLVKATEP